MNTKDIQLFLAIARIGSISRTAEQLFMSQSTVTTRLQRLERELSYALFDRLPNGVQLTVQGQRLLPLSERMMALENRMTSPDTVTRPVLRLMSGRAFVSTDVPECLTRMLRVSNVHLSVRMGMYEEMTNALLANQVDFCFIGEPIFHPHVRQLELPEDQIDLVVPENHHFIHHFPGISAITHEPMIAFSRETAPFRRRVSNLLAREHVFPNVRMELDSIDGIKAMVAHGLGVSFLPRRTLHDALSKGYVAIPIQSPGWVRPTLLTYPDNREEEPLTKQFIDIVQSYYEDLSGQ